ncbi:MAG: hypothetical protein ACP5NF_09900 [Thermoanaerobaculum sp.]
MKKIATALFLLLAFSAASFAQMGMGGGMDGMAPVVAPTGEVLVVRPTLNQQQLPNGMELVVLSPVGQVLWTWRAEAGLGEVVVVGQTVLVAVGAGFFTPGGTTGNAQLVALHLANGVELWRLNLPAMVHGLTPAGDRVYAFVGGGSAFGSQNSGNQGGMGRGHMGGSRGNGGMNPGQGSWNHSLVAISLSGQILWAFPPLS